MALFKSLFRRTSRRYPNTNAVEGAAASARLYSLVETAKANALEPYAYLRHVLTWLPRAQSVDDIDAMLPWNVPRESLIL